MIKNLNKVVIVFLFLIFLSISAVSAQDNATSEIDLSENTTILEVEDNDRLNVEMNKSDLKGSTSTFTDLQNIINKAPIGGTITLNKDYTYVFGDNAIIINKPLTIDGKNHVLNGRLATRIFWISGDQVTLKNIRFINANNTQTDWGGAIDWFGDNANLENCYFKNNHARKLGGAIYLHGTQGNIKNCTFNNNHAEKGGAVYWNGNNGKLNSCSFVNNHADGYGGAVYWCGNNGNCSFVNNHAKIFKGNVIYWFEPGDIFACTFSVFRPKNTNTVTTMLITMKMVIKSLIVG
ncbi:hypothetical protein [Methanobrevibacter oralis]|uniref:hypothetical protein n=1 Tax=Methanobrevibacter oralis TaxID=66851 RepID=UPI001C730928|nr:hypothetical protein [Methanobrevibacter oralis]